MKKKYYVWYEHKLYDNGPYTPIIVEASNEEEAVKNFDIEFPNFYATEAEEAED